MKIHFTARCLRRCIYSGRAFFLLALLVPLLGQAAVPSPLIGHGYGRGEAGAPYRNDFSELLGAWNGAGTAFTGGYVTPDNDGSRAAGPWAGQAARAVVATFYSKPAGDLDALSTYGTNPGGSGAAPTSFSAPGQLFSISGINRTIVADWTVSGAGSTVVLESAASFFIPAAFNYTGPLDLNGTATLVVEHPAPGVTFGNLNAASTVEFIQAGAYTAPALAAPGYGNLTLRNGSKFLSPGTTFVRGNLTVNDVGLNVNDVFGGDNVSISTLNLEGNLTLVGSVVCSTDGRIELLATGAAAQVLDGGLNTLRLRKLTLGTGHPGLSLADGTTYLELGDGTGGGYQLATSTVLTVNNNTLAFSSGSAAVITNSAANLGMLAVSPGTNLLFNRGFIGPVGTLRLTPGFNQLNNLTLDVPVTANPLISDLVLTGGLTVGGTLELASGILGLGPNNALTLNGNVNTTTGSGFLNGSDADLIIGGAGTLNTLGFRGGGGAGVQGTQLGSFTLNRPGATLNLTTDLTVNKALTLISGVLGISSKSGASDLTLRTTVSTTPTGLLQGSVNSNLRILGNGPLGTVRFTAAGGVLNTLQLNRAGGTLAIEGNSLLAVGATLTSGILSLGAGVGLTLTGPLVVANPAVARFAVTPTSSLSFTGGALPVSNAIGPLAFVPGQDVLGSLTLNRNVVASVPTANLVTNLTVNNLTFTFGRLFVTGTNTLAVLPGGSVTGGGVNSFVNVLSRGATTTLPLQSVPLFYPLGRILPGLPAATAAQYRPLDFNPTVATPGTASYTARQIEDPTPVRTLPASLVRVSQVRYYNVVADAGATSTLQSATIRLSYSTANAQGADGVTPGSVNLLRVAMTDPADNTKWLNIGGTGSGTGLGSILSNSFAPGQLGDFVLATDGSTPIGVNPLPVELVRFGVVRQPAGVRVAWATASEKNSAYFDVQRSTNGREFVRVATATAQGTSSQPTAYAALDDKAPASRLYYRLRQVDLDGTQAYSPVVTVAGTGATAAGELSLYPNPATDRLVASLPAVEGRGYRILNTVGQVLAKGPAATADPAIDLRGLPAGIYFLELRSPEGKQMQRFAKE